LNKELIINAAPLGVEIALLEDKKLVELHHEKTDASFAVGDLYLGKVKKLIPGLNAAFVDVGFEKDAFLHYTDLSPYARSLLKFTQISINDNSPAGYDLNKPEKFSMPPVLLEISGISFKEGNSNILYSEQDEEGKVFYLKPGDAKAQHTKFGKNGDYEDIAICDDKIIILKSDGSLYFFSLSEIGKPDATNVKEYKNILPAGEYEGLFCDNKTKQLYALCKSCKDIDASKTGRGYIISITSTGEPVQNGSFNIPVKEIAAMANEKKIKVICTKGTIIQLVGYDYIAQNIFYVFP